MPLYKFGSNDVYYNTIEAYPSCSFFIYDGETFYNNQTAISGAFINGRAGIERTGYVSLYELNIDRRNDVATPGGPVAGRPAFIGKDGETFRVDDTGRIYPYVIKKGNLGNSLKTTSGRDYIDKFKDGDVMAGSYSLSASISREFFPANHANTIKTLNTDVLSVFTSDSLPITEHANRIRALTTGSHIDALRNRLDFNAVLSDHYHYTASGAEVGEHWDKSTQAVNLISIPSIFYGSSIKKGSVSLRYYISGTLISELQDTGRNGELIQVGPTLINNGDEPGLGAGLVAGVVMYKEGFIMLTGSWDLSPEGADALPTFAERDVFGALTNQTRPKWINFGNGMYQPILAGHDQSPGRDAKRNVSGSYAIDFLGTTRISTVSMMTHAKKGELNWSNNPTFITSSASSSYVTPKAGKYRYFENELDITNMVSSSFAETTGSLQRTTFISKVGIYDEDKNLIAVASLANPVKKTDERDLTIKLKLDI